MADFQWNESHIDWFVARFKDESYDIETRIVQRTYRRKQGEIRQSSQDFRNLMRLVVQSKFARVTKSCVDSKRYRIRMVSAQYPYVQELFDQELLSQLHLIDLILEPNGFIEYFFPALGLQDWDDSYQQMWEGALRQASIYRDAFSVYNFSGGDFDNIFRLKEVSGDEDIKNSTDYLSRQINYLICQYKAFKVASPELTRFLKKAGIYKKIEDYNSLFLLVLESTISFQLFVFMTDKNQGYQESFITQNRRMKESLKAFDKGELMSTGRGVYRSNEYKVLASNALFWAQLPSISSRAEVLEAVWECKKAFLDMGFSRI